MTLLEKLDALNDEWQSARDYSPFVRDGLLIEDDWARASPRILFLMKEAYRKAAWWEISGSPIGTVKRGKVGKIWQNILRWKFLLTKYFNDGELPPFPELQSIPEIANSEGRLTSIAYVNVSKELGDSSSNQKEIQNRAIKDREFLVRQIDLLDPDVVLCARTFWSYHPIYNGNNGNSTMTRVSDRVYSHGRRTVIDFYHPGKPAGNRDKELYAKLQRILQELTPYRVPYRCR
ncbi:MAG: hypothetical protein JW808_09920 [Victivallales bacterium]|nr:hypothetical protein [Victivallales bacterium]